MWQQPYDKFKASVGKNLPQNPSPAKANAWGNAAASSQITSTIQTAKSQATTPAHGQPSPSAGMAVHKLDSDQSGIYYKWRAWGDSRKVPVADIFAKSPNFPAFDGFMKSLHKELDEPLPGFDSAGFLNAQLGAYYSQSNVAAPQTGWGGKSGTALPPKPSVKQPAQPTVEAKDATPPRPTQVATAQSASRHFKDINNYWFQKHNGDLGLPTDIDTLIAYVKDSLDHFLYVEGTEGKWSMQLGEVKTRISGGNPPEYAARPWSIVLNSKAGVGRIFHYGPTAYEND